MLLGLVQRERTGEVINRSLIKSITQMLVDLGVTTRAVYEDDFERHFLETSANFYRVESQEFIRENSCADYMKKVHICQLLKCDVSVAVSISHVTNRGHAGGGASA